MSQSRAPDSATLEERGQQAEAEKNNVLGSISPNVEVEVKRLNYLHRWQALVTSSLYWPIDEVRELLAPREGATPRVLSVNSKSSSWPVEMAMEFPHADVLSIDNRPEQPSDNPPNLRFEVLDLVKDDISHLRGVFDVVHCSRGTDWMAPHKPFWAKLSELVKPGGILLYVTGNMVVYDENKTLMKPAEVGDEPGTSSWWARLGVEMQTYAPLMSDVPMNMIAEGIMDWLNGDPNLENARVKQVYLPIGWSGTDEDNLEHGEEIGRLVGLTAVERSRFVRSTLLAKGMPAELLDLCLRESEADILEQRIKSYTRWGWFTATGRVF